MNIIVEWFYKKLKYDKMTSNDKLDVKNNYKRINELKNEIKILKKNISKIYSKY